MLGFTALGVLLAAFWLSGVVGPEALLGLAVFGAVWGGDRGLGSDEPLPPVWWKMLEELKRALGPKPEPEGLPPFLVSELPPVELEQERWPTSFPGPMDTEKVLEALEWEIVRSFKEEIRSRFGGPKKAAEEFFRSLSSPPTLQFEMPSPRRPAGKPKAKEETFTQRLDRLAREPESREITFTERLERLARQPEPREPTFTQRLEQLAREGAPISKETPDFRTEGERRRDARQRAERRGSLKKEPSPMEKPLAQVEAEGKKGRKAKAPSSRKKTADEVWEETTTQAEKLNAIQKRIAAGEAHPMKEVFAIAALPDSLVGLSPKLARARAEAREKVLEIFEKGKIPEVVPLGEGVSFEQPSVDPSMVQAISGMFEVLQDPETIWTLEDRKIIGRDIKGNVLAEGSVVGSSTFYTLNSAGEFAAINPPVLVGWGVEIRVSPPAKEHLTVYYGLGRHLSAGIIYGSDEDGRPATGIALNIGLSVPLGIPYVLSTPIDPKEIIKELPEEFTPGG